jgi:branched-chain amino acid transport system ATP-binding protein
VSLRVESGSVVGIAGPNGAGKTTLFDAVTGRVRMESGRIRLMGREIGGLPAYRRARLGVGRTFQAPLVPTGLTVGQTIAAARMAHAPVVPAHEVGEIRRLVGFHEDDNRLSGELDTLGRRRLLLCCLLMRRPKVLLLDEPCSGLEAGEIGEMETMIGRVTEWTDLATVVVEHRLEFLYNMAQRVSVLHEGQVIAEGRPGEVFADLRVREAYFEAPRVT